MEREGKWQIMDMLWTEKYKRLIQCSADVILHTADALDTNYDLGCKMNVVIIFLQQSYIKIFKIFKVNK